MNLQKLKEMRETAEALQPNNESAKAASVIYEKTFHDLAICADHNSSAIFDNKYLRELWDHRNKLATLYFDETSSMGKHQLLLEFHMVSRLIKNLLGL